MKPQTTLKLFDFVTANKNFINILSLAGPKIASCQQYNTTSQKRLGQKKIYKKNSVSLRMATE